MALSPLHAQWYPHAVSPLAMLDVPHGGTPIPVVKPMTCASNSFVPRPPKKKKRKENNNPPTPDAQ